jgi:hypothetical protein
MAFSVEEFKQQNPQFQNIPDEEILAMYEATAPSREVQQPMPSSRQPTPPTEEDTSFGSAIVYGLDQPLENIGTTLEALGAEGVGDWFKDIIEAPEDYASATEDFINKQGKGFEFGYLPRATVEQSGQLGGSLASAGLGFALAGPVGALVGPALFEMIQLLGPVALNRAKNNRREEPSWEDWSIAALASGTSGALNAIGIKNLSLLNNSLKTGLASAGREAVTEGAQSIVEQTGSTAGTLAGLDLDAKQALGEGILGGTAAGSATVPSAVLASNQETATETKDAYQLALEAVVDAKNVNITTIRQATGITNIPELKGIIDRMYAEGVIQKEDNRFIPNQNFVRNFKNAQRLKRDDEESQNENILSRSLERFNIFQTPNTNDPKTDAGVQFNQSDNTNVTNFIYKVQDKFIDPKLIQEQITEKRKKEGLDPIADEADFYGGLTVFEGRTEEQIRQLENQEVIPMVEEMKARDINQEMIDEFAQMRHAPERNAFVAKIDENQPDGGSGINTADAEAIMKTKYGLDIDPQVITEQIVNPDYQILLDSIAKLQVKKNLDTREQNRLKKLQSDLAQTNRIENVDRISYQWKNGNQLGRKMQKFFQDHVDPMLQKNRDIMQDAGLVAEEEVDGWQKNYNFYVPLKGIAGDEKVEGFPPPTGRGMSIIGKENRRVKGRKGVQSASPLLNTIADRTAKIIRAEKNKVMNELLTLAEQNPNDALWEVFSEDTPVFRDAFQVFYVNPTNPDIESNTRKDGYVKNYRIKPTKASKYQLQNMDDLIGLKRDGKQHYIKLNNVRMLTALKNLGVQENSKIIKIFGPISRYLSMINTSLNPEFMVSNFFRDIQTGVFALITEQDIGKLDGEAIAKQVVKDTPSSMKTMYRGFRKNQNPKAFESLPVEEQQMFNDFLSSGAKADWFYVPTINEVADNVNNLMEMTEGKKNFKQGMTTLFKYVDDVNASVENGVRFATYKNARKAGISKKQSAILAKNLTVNFNRKGMDGQTLNSLYLFFNASVQGTANMLRGLKTSKRKQQAVAGLATFAMLNALYNEMVGGDDEETGRSHYSRIPDYIKERNFIVMDPRGTERVPGTVGKEGLYFKFPLPYGYSVFHNLGTGIADTLMGVSSPAQSASLITGGMLTSFNPIGFSRSKDLVTGGVKTATPTALVPLVEVAMNENFFGAPVYTENFPIGAKRSDSSLAKKNTNEFLKKLMPFLNEMTGGSKYKSGLIDVSPDTVQHLFDTVLGGAGQTARRTLSLAEETTKSIVARGELPDVPVGQIPFIRRVRGEPDPFMSQTEYFQRKQNVINAVAEYDDMSGSLLSKRRKEYKDRYGNLMKMEQRVKNTDRVLKRLRDRRQKLDDKIPQNVADALNIADQIEVLDERIRKEYNKFNKKYDEKVGRFD